MEGKEVEIELKNPYLMSLLVFLLVVFYFEVSVTLNGPIAFGDEGYHTEMAKWIGTHLEYPIYQPLYGSALQKQGYAYPPMFHFFEGSFYFIFGFSETIIKFLLPILSFFLGLAAFLIFKRIFSAQVGFIAAIILVTIPAIVTYSVLFYIDIFLTHWFLFSIGFFLLAIKEEKRKYFIFSGFFAALAILTKKPAYILLVFYGLYFLYELVQKKKFFDLAKKYLPIVVAMAVVVGPFFVRNFAHYGTPLCGLPYLFTGENCNVDITYKNIVDFTQRTANSGTDVNVYQYGLINYFLFVYGVVIFGFPIPLIPLLFFLGMLYLLVKRDRIDIAIFVFLVSISGLFLYTYQGRAEDASRYTLVAAPFIALVAAVYLEKIGEVLKKYYKYFGVSFLILIVIISFYNFYSKILYMPQVKQFSPLFFEACKWADTNLPSNATMLSLNTHPTVYNCQRQAIWELQDLPDIVLSNNLNLTVNRLHANGISLIFVQKFSMSQEAYRISYPVSFIAFLESNPQTFKKVFENGPSYGTCLQSGGCDGTAIYQVVG